LTARPVKSDELERDDPWLTPVHVECHLQLVNNGPLFTLTSIMPSILFTFYAMFNKAALIHIFAIYPPLELRQRKGMNRHVGCVMSKFTPETGMQSFCCCYKGSKEHAIYALIRL
jgi:hypothetical protein